MDRVMKDVVAPPMWPLGKDKLWDKKGTKERHRRMRERESKRINQRTAIDGRADSEHAGTCVCVCPRSADGFVCMPVPALLFVFASCAQACPISRF